MKVLVFGLPGSGKTTLSKYLAICMHREYGRFVVHINADAMRKKYNDWTFDSEARVRQAYRMKYLADGVNMAGCIAIADFVCPTEETRDIFDPDITIWMNTIDSGRFEDTNKMFQKPEKNIDLIITKGFMELSEAEASEKYGKIVANYIDSKIVDVERIFPNDRPLFYIDAKENSNDV